MIRIVLADDHLIFRESLRMVLETQGFAQVVGEASDGNELLKLLLKKLPDIILMDIAMPNMDGIEATRQVISRYPGMKILVLSTMNDDSKYYSLLEAGVKGFVQKTAGIKELQSAIKEVDNGECWFSSELLQRVIFTLNEEKKKSKAVELNKRELEILKLICECYTNEQIARKVNLSPETVKWHRANIMTKTGCKNTVGLVIYAIKQEIITIY